MGLSSARSFGEGPCCGHRRGWLDDQLRGKSRPLRRSERTSDRGSGARTERGRLQRRRCHPCREPSRTPLRKLGGTGAMIVRPVFRATWAELLHLPVRLGLVLCMLAPDWLFAILGKHPTLNPGKGLWFALILGAGLIGRPASNGTLALLLSRPVRRADYVLTRWLAVSAIASLVAAGNLLLLGLLQGIKRRPGPHASCGGGGHSWSNRHGSCTRHAFVSRQRNRRCRAAGHSHPERRRDAAAGRIPVETEPHVDQAPFGRWLVPRLDLETTFRSSPISWLAIFAYLSTVTLCIAGAIELMRRREISYAGHGD